MQKTSLVAALALAILSSSAIGADFPTGPIRIVVPFAPGGTVDGPMRALAQSITERTGKVVIVENRPGAGGSAGTAAVAAAAPDGHTLLASTTSTPIAQALYKKAGFDSLTSFQHIAMVATTPTVVVVSKRVKANTLQELAAELKAKPGSLTYGSPGNGTASHLAAELLKEHLHVDMLHVPYKGAAPALNDLLGGQIDVLLAGLSSSLGHIKQGSIRALAVTSLSRSPLLPNVPSVAETFPGYEFVPWMGLAAPAGTPAAVTRWLDEQVRTALSTPEVKRRFEEMGADAAYLPPTEITARLATEVTRYRIAIDRAKVSID